MRRFRIPEDRRPDFERLRELRPHRPRWLRGPDTEAMRDRIADFRERDHRPSWLAIPALKGLHIPEMDVPTRVLAPAIAVILLLFGGGLYFGNLLGSDPSAAGTGLITTVTEKGTVVTKTLSGKKVKITVPARTITKKTKPERRPASTSTSTETATSVFTTTRTQQVPVPTTIIHTVTTTRTVTATVTTTTTVTVPST